MRLLYHISPKSSIPFSALPDLREIASFLAKLKKENEVTARRSSLPLSESLSAKSPHFLFSDLELDAFVVDKERESRKQERGLHALCAVAQNAGTPLPLGERRTLDVDWSLRKSMSRVLWRYCWHNSKNTTAKGDYTYE